MDYPSNLADLSWDDRQAIEQDKQLWLDAHRAVRSLDKWQIKHQLSMIEDEIIRADMRRRLNICWQNMNNLK